MQEVFWIRGALILSVAGSLFCGSFARAQDGVQSGPKPQGMTTSPKPGEGSEEVLPQAPRPQPTGRLTLGERFKLEARVSFGISAVIAPAAEAGYTMANPPSHYPREWKDGAGAYGRNYGAELARHTAGGLTRFATAAVDGEDPRYYPSESRRIAPRFWHAVWFTVSDKTNGGRRTLALSNFTGAAAAGFVGMPYEPEGYNDFTHGTQRAGLEFATYAGHNLVTEFSPELYRTARAMHIPAGFTKIFVSETPGKKP